MEACALIKKPKNAPRNHATGRLVPEGDEFIPERKDEAGEKKITTTGHLLDGRYYKFQTFSVLDRGNKLFALAFQCGQVLGYSGAADLIAKNKSLYKMIATEAEREDLRDRGLIPLSHRKLPIVFLTAKSLFRQFGSKVIINGRRGNDDYWEQWASEKDREAANAGSAAAETIVQASQTFSGPGFTPINQPTQILKSPLPQFSAEETKSLSRPEQTLTLPALSVSNTAQMQQIQQYPMSILPITSAHSIAPSIPPSPKQNQLVVTASSASGECSKRDSDEVGPTEIKRQRLMFNTMTTCTSFPLFSSLPEAVRAKIWSLNLPGPRTVALHYSSALDLPHARGCTSPALIPSNLHTNKEARADAQKHYALSFNLPHYQPMIWFNPLQDVLYLPPKDGWLGSWNHFVNALIMIAPGELGIVKRLAVSEALFRNIGGCSTPRSRVREFWGYVRKKFIGAEEVAVLLDENDVAVGVWSVLDGKIVESPEELLVQRLEMVLRSR